MNEGTSVPETLDTSATVQKIVKLVKENQLATAVILFASWQLGLFVSAYDYVQGGVC